MGSTQTKADVIHPPVVANNGVAAAATDENKPKCKPCCACPDTKRVRDECVILNGEENCAKEIEAHRACMRAAGFNI
jgi:cytochrome c oxidase assembly protein subunit 17